MQIKRLKLKMGDLRASLLISTKEKKNYLQDEWYSQKGHTDHKHQIGKVL
jgi:hypothetical protein